MHNTKHRLFIIQEKRQTIPSPFAPPWEVGEEGRTLISTIPTALQASWKNQYVNGCVVKTRDYTYR